MAETESTEQEKAKQEIAEQLLVVGIGGSAGSVAALREFFDAVPDDCGIAFIVVLHLSPEHKSEMPRILQTRTSMTVEQVTGRVKLRPDHVYIIPPGKNLELLDGHLDISDFDEPRGRRMPIDVFFRSHAEHHPDGVAIVLSGTGTDGSVGIKHVKETGALVMAQAPQEAEFDSMPRSAIATGVVDVVAPVRQLARQVIDYRDHRRAGVVPKPDQLEDGGEIALRAILDRVHGWTEHDFSGYKRSTLLRRIARRMHVVGADTLSDYLEVVRESDEAHALFRDLLISVTSFFRDDGAWESLAKHVVPKLFEGRAADETIRVWVAGCATGEEAYSIAILLAEHAALLSTPPSFLIFATDLDDRALALAREGIYPEAIVEDVSADRLRRFFEHEEGTYRVSKRIREKVLIASHNLLRDPPFSKIDVVTCRNLLIYLQRDLQRHVASVFRYALQPGGFLFLGISESLDDEEAAFATEDNTYRIYRRLTGSRDPLFMPQLPLPGITRHDPQHEHHEAHPQHRSSRSEAQALLEAIDEHAPPSLLVDARGRIRYVSSRAGRYLVHPAGEVTAELIKVIRPELRDELRTALFRAFDRGEGSTSRAVQVRFNGDTGFVHLLVMPAHRDETDRRALVLFSEVDRVEVDKDNALDGEPDPLVRQLEEELQRTREQLRLTSEEYEAQREEMKARNEELRSMNEEYRLATEELETSKEELQSTNEELQTVNHELKAKIDEISQAHVDLQNLLDSTDITTIFLDRDLRIQRYTHTTAKLFHIRASDIGRPLSDLKPRMVYEGLLEDAQRAFDKLEVVEHEVQADEGQWFLVRHRPYRADDRIEGVLLTFVEITAQKDAESEAQRARVLAEAIVDSVRESLLVLDTDLRVVTANQSFYRTFAVSPGDTVGRLVYELGNNQWDIPELRKLLDEVLPEDKAFNDYELTHDFEQIGSRTMLLNARRLDHVQRILLAIEDVTDREHR